MHQPRMRTRGDITAGTARWLVLASVCMLFALLANETSHDHFRPAGVISVHAALLSSVASKVQLLINPPFTPDAPGLLASDLGITSIDVDFCSTIGAVIGGTAWKKIVSLDLSNNSLSSLPNGLLKGNCFYYLNTLNMSSNLLNGTALSQAALSFVVPQITVWDFSNNPIGSTGLPANWGSAAFFGYSGAAYITPPSLYMQNCNLTTLPINFFALSTASPSINVLNLANNQLGLNPASVLNIRPQAGSFYALNIILSNNGLVTPFLPSADWRNILRQATSLDLSYNNLGADINNFCLFISDRNGVDRYIFRVANISWLPTNCLFNTWPNVLDFSDNPLSYIQPGAFNSGCGKLNLDGCLFSETNMLPISTGGGLLSLRRNLFTTLVSPTSGPLSFLSYKTVGSLDLSYNKITSIPAMVFQGLSTSNGVLTLAFNNISFIDVDAFKTNVVNSAWGTVNLTGNPMLGLPGALASGSFNTLTTGMLILDQCGFTASTLSVFNLFRGSAITTLSMANPGYDLGTTAGTTSWNRFNPLPSGWLIQNQLPTLSTLIIGDVVSCVPMVFSNWNPTNQISLTLHFAVGSSPLAPGGVFTALSGYTLAPGRVALQIATIEISGSQLAVPATLDSGCQTSSCMVMPNILVIAMDPTLLTKQLFPTFSTATQLKLVPPSVLIRDYSAPWVGLAGAPFSIPTDLISTCTVGFYFTLITRSSPTAVSSFPLQQLPPTLLTSAIGGKLLWAFFPDLLFFPPAGFIPPGVQSSINRTLAYNGQVPIPVGLFDKVALVTLTDTATAAQTVMTLAQCPYWVNGACASCPLGSNSVGLNQRTSNEVWYCACTIGHRCDILPSMPCAAGWQSTSITLNTCAQCPAGTYNSLANSTCVQCPGGTASSTIGATSVTQCSICNAGSFAPAGSSACSQCSPGNYSGVPSSPSCSQCAAGFWAQNSGMSACSACAAGLFSTGGSTVCSSCAAGTYSSASSSSATCVPCAIGTYSAGGTSVCSQCAAGQYTNQLNTVTCTSCDQGWRSASNTGSTACTICSAGSFAPGATSTCTQCSAGMFNAAPGLTSCANCAAGQYSIVNSGSTSCVSCAAGSISTSPVSSCSQCTSGWFAASTGLSVCSSCLAGNFSGNGASVCSVCSAGKYSAATANTCATCAAGTYGLAATGATGCGNCLTGQYATAGSTTCTQCAAGTYSVAANPNGYCSSCAAGSFSLGGTGTSSCTACPAGLYTPNAGLSVCLACLTGTYSLGNAASCTQCELGKYCSSTSVLSTVCAAGSYNPTLGQTICTLCQPGTFQPNLGQIYSYACMMCGAGTASAVSGLIAQSGCTTCAPGRASAITGAAVCPICTPGKYQSASGTYACTDCPANTFQPLSSQTSLSSCIACPKLNGVNTLSSPGSGPVESCSVLGPGVLTVSIYSCVPGQYFNATGAGSCRSCPPGSSSQSAVTACTQCAVGTIAPDVASPQCSVCPIGWAAPSVGLTSCSACAAGSTSSADSASCVPCAGGSFSASAGSTCSMCAPGEISELSSKSTTCVECDVGSSSPAGAVTCSLCAPGTFNNATGSTCASCPAGTSSALNLGSTECLPCAAGSTAAAGSETCTACASGTYNSAPGSGSCLSCPPGQYSIAASGSTWCSVCEAGTFSTGAVSVCADCAAGSFAANTGLSKCSACTAGSYSGSGAVSCTQAQCTAGSYPAADGTCADCAAGSYSLDGAAACSPCPAGQFNPQSGQSTCALCQAGTFQPSLGQTYAFSCLMCSPNQYSGPGMAACLACAPGTNSTMGATVCTVPGAQGGSGGDTIPIGPVSALPFPSPPVTSAESFASICTIARIMCADVIAQLNLASGTSDATSGTPALLSLVNSASAHLHNITLGSAGDSLAAGSCPELYAAASPKCTQPTTFPSFALHTSLTQLSADGSFALQLQSVLLSALSGSWSSIARPDVNTALAFAQTLGELLAPFQVTDASGGTTLQELVPAAWTTSVQLVKSILATLTSGQQAILPAANSRRFVSSSIPVGGRSAALVSGGLGLGTGVDLSSSLASLCSALLTGCTALPAVTSVLRQLMVTVIVASPSGEDDFAWTTPDFRAEITRRSFLTGTASTATGVVSGGSLQVNVNGFNVTLPIPLVVRLQGATQDGVTNAILVSTIQLASQWQTCLEARLAGVQILSGTGQLNGNDTAGARLVTQPAPADSATIALLPGCTAANSIDNPQGLPFSCQYLAGGAWTSVDCVTISGSTATSPVTCDCPTTVIPTLRAAPCGANTTTSFVDQWWFLMLALAYAILALASIASAVQWTRVHSAHPCWRQLHATHPAFGLLTPSLALLTLTAILRCVACSFSSQSAAGIATSASTLALLSGLGFVTLPGLLATSAATWSLLLRVTGELTAGVAFGAKYSPERKLLDGTSGDGDSTSPSGIFLSPIWSSPSMMASVLLAFLLALGSTSGVSSGPLVSAVLGVSGAINLIAAGALGMNAVAASTRYSNLAHSTRRTQLQWRLALGCTVALLCLSCCGMLVAPVFTQADLFSPHPSSVLAAFYVVDWCLLVCLIVCAHLVRVVGTEMLHDMTARRRHIAKGKNAEVAGAASDHQRSDEESDSGDDSESELESTSNHVNTSQSSSMVPILPGQIGNDADTDESSSESAQPESANQPGASNQVEQHAANDPSIPAAVISDADAEAEEPTPLPTDATPAQVEEFKRREHAWMMAQRAKQDHAWMLNTHSLASEATDAPVAFSIRATQKPSMTRTRSTAAGRSASNLIGSPSSRGQTKPMLSSSPSLVSHVRSPSNSGVAVRAGTTVIGTPLTPLSRAAVGAASRAPNRAALLRSLLTSSSTAAESASPVAVGAIVSPSGISWSADSTNDAGRSADGLLQPLPDLKLPPSTASQ